MSQNLPRNAIVADSGVLDDRFWQQAEQLCRTVAPQDLANLPLYLLPQSRMTAELGTEHHYAFTMSRADLLFRDQIPTWLGRGPCIVINDIALVEDFDPSDLHYVTINCVLHELAHLLDQGVQYTEEQSPSASKVQFERLVVTDVMTRPRRADLPRYLGHEATFIRTALHLAHRAVVAGFDTMPAGVVHSQRYGLSSMVRYAEALGDEPQRLVDHSFHEIRGIELPEDFQDVWHADLDRYHRRFTSHYGDST